VLEGEVWKLHVSVHFERYFCPCPRQKNVESSAESGDLVDVEDVFRGSIEYFVRAMGLVSFYCNCSAH